MTPSAPRRIAVCALAALFGTLTALPAPARDDNETPTQLVNRVLTEAWKDRGVTPPRKTTDAEFAQKLYTDLLGRAPTAKEIATLEKDKAADKRAKLIEWMLAGDGWADRCADVWTNSLLPAQYNAAYKTQFRKWIAKQLVAGTSYADIVKAMVTATGKTTDNGAVHFILANMGTALPEQRRADDGLYDMIPVTIQTGRVFLGQGFQCVVCHNHPFNKDLVQRDFWGLNVFFRQGERIGEPGNDATAVLELKDSHKLNSDAVVKYMRRSGFMDATGMNLLNGKAPRGPVDRPRREILADYIVKNNLFAPVAVNRTWTTLLSRGLLEEPGFEEFGEFNEPVYPELLSGLASAFRESKFDQKQLLAWICNSEVYQLHAVAEGDDDKNFFRIKKRPADGLWERCPTERDVIAP